MTLFQYYLLSLRPILLLTLCLPAMIWGVGSTVATSIGYRMDQLEWSIAGSGGTPKVGEELIFTDVSIAEIGIQLRAEAAANFVLIADGSMGTVLSGNVRNSDYLGYNKTNEISRVTASNDDGHVWDFSAAAGQVVCFRNVDARFTPLVGYSFHRQHFTMTNGQSIIPGTGAIDGLDSWYESDWYGPWIGLDTTFSPMACLEVSIEGRMHWNATSYGEGFFNLRSDADDDFTHRSDGSGYTLKGAIDYSLPGKWIIGLLGKWEDWESNSGRHRTYFTSVGTNTVGVYMDTPFNGARWMSYSISLTATRDF